jgi:hypothetical protein
MEILHDGSVAGQTFSGDKYTGGYPSVKDNESPEAYKERVDKDFVKKGFDLGDLSWGDWAYYCGDHSYE